MEEDFSQQSTDLIARHFELELGEEKITEEQLFELLSDRVAYMIEYRIDFLMSLLYRLDVAEAKINHALHPAAEEPANRGLARLILDRQKERIKTKKHYKIIKPEDLGDLAF